jgi:putative OmpL-like beta-barrel porin-2
MNILMKSTAICAVVAVLWGPMQAYAEPAAPPAAEMSRDELVSEVEDLRSRLERLEQIVLANYQDAGSPPTGETTADGDVPLVKAAYPEHAAAVPPAGYSNGAPVNGAQAPDPEPEEVGIVSTGVQPITFTGLVDVYYSNNFNNPASGDNQLYYTNPNSKGFGLNQAKLEIEANPIKDIPVGVRADIWFGSGARLFREGLEPGPLEDVIYLQQAYGYYQFKNGSQLDVGLFGTIAGLEVAESHLNWNYSRGLLWAWNEPFSHMGAKYTTPITDTLSATVMLVNGFDNARDNNSGKSYGVQGSWAPNDHFNTTLTWIQGPENSGTNEGWQKDLSWNFYAKLHERFEIMTNYDSIWGANPDGTGQLSWGLGGYARINLADKWAVSQRFEYFDDSEARSTGVDQILKEYTATLEFKPLNQLVTRLEYRRDWSTTQFFDRGNTPSSANNQDTLSLGLMYIFGPGE